ncbi:head-tail adaptor protein [Actinomyces minihominis]|uniref:head-tail adaptor protein n=1 Tax=Actinomyces minihominis TaxID=2002838 RepID=UPI000C06CE4B|nr:head-tail adaptor protein [Actinomyces minihominis]
MSFGKMNTPITICEAEVVTDTSGFQETQYLPIATTRAFVEARHATSAWVNRAAFSKATHSFRLRMIPGLDVISGLVVEAGGKHYTVESVEDVRGRGRYLEILAKLTEPQGTGHGSG